MTCWRLEAYERGGAELLVAEYPLIGVTTEDVREVTGEASTNLMYDVFPLPETQLAWAQAAAGVHLDAARFAYFLAGVFEGT